MSFFLLSIKSTVFDLFHQYVLIRFGLEFGIFIQTNNLYDNIWNCLNQYLNFMFLHTLCGVCYQCFIWAGFTYTYFFAFDRIWKFFFLHIYGDKLKKRSF
jgi:hypothetical protein